LTTEAGGSIEQNSALGTVCIGHDDSPFARACARVGQRLDGCLSGESISMYGNASQKFKLDYSGDPALFPLI
jgi:hypothetical protein